MSLHSSTRRSGAEIILQALKDQGVEIVFGYPGGAVLPIYDAIFKQNAIRHILVRHEQAAEVRVALDQVPGRLVGGARLLEVHE